MSTEQSETTAPQASETAADPDAPRRALVAAIEVRENGTVLYDGIAIGGLDFAEQTIIREGVTVATPLDEPRLTLNLGWMRAAGLHIRVLDDPALERHRNGIALER